MVSEEKSNHQFHAAVNSLPVIAISDLIRYGHWYSNGMSVIGVTNHFGVNLRPVPKDRTYTWYHYLSQECATG